MELLFRIIGIGSASGLFFNGNSLFLVSDNSHMLYEYKMTEKTLEKTALAAPEYSGPLENVPKNAKADYEAIAEHNGILYLFGSGSTENRNLIGRINMKTKEVLPHLDATDLYLIMQDFGGIDAANFNIEAAVNDGDTWYLLQRGNGPEGRNAIYTLTGDINDLSFQILYNEIKLPKIKGTRTSFTDAVKVGGKLYFLAAAEQSASTYHDGAVAGTLAGVIDIETMKLGRTKTISDTHKFEGITLYKDSGKTLEFLLCEDSDNNAGESDIYKLRVSK